MIKKILNCSFFIFLFICFNVYSQKFPNEREKFAKEWQKILEDADAQEFAKKELPKMLKSTKFSDGHFSKMVDACNFFASKNIPIYPQLFQYMQCWVYQTESKFSASFNSEWQNIAKTYLDKEEQLNYFIEFSNNLYKYGAFSNQGDFFWAFEKGNLTWNTDKKLTITCSNGNLTCRVVRQKEVVDSIIVFNTFGTYDVFKNKWEGSQGMITWEKVKFDKTKTFAKLRSYKLEMNIAQLKVDTVELTTPYFSTPILGKLYDKTIIELNEGENSPQFNSFEKRLKIPDLNENMDYDGGFTLQGDEFIGQGTIENPAKILLKYNSKVLFEISAIKFEMDPQKVIARDAKSKMFYPSGDSLVQTQSFINLDFKKKELSISAVQKGNQFLPYFDSYFKIYIHAPLLNWRLNTPLPYFTYDVGTANEQRNAYFESIDYFDRSLFQKYKGMGSNHPFNLIAKKVNDTGKKQLKLADFANALGQSITNAEILVVDLVGDGFAQYNSLSKTIKVEDKLLHFVGASSGESDYDNIRIETDFRPIKKPNENKDPELMTYYEAVSQRRKKQIAYAVIDINKLNMRFNEVESVLLSQTQETEVFLDSAYIIMEKNRDLRFCGWLVSGKFEIHTPLSKFDYQSFKVNILSSDYAFLRVKPLNPQDAPAGETIPMISSISNFRGELQIDDPSNRSGKKGKNGQFPLVKSIEEAFVYYNSKKIVSGAYDSLRFYYALKPFEIDSLDNFHEKSFQLSGRLVSGGIFPELDENLTIMNDYSFGFITKAPEEGYAFYGTSSKYKNKIFLSGNGLQGSGSIDFIHSNSVSNKLTFLPDSTIGIAKFSNKQISDGVKFPDIKSDEAYICYQPVNELLKVRSYRETPLEIFEQEALMMGEIRLKKNGASGRGSLDLRDATLRSEKFDFTDLEFSSDLCSFYLRNRFSQRGENPLSIQSDSLKAFVSFKERKGDFTSSGTKRIKFPPNEFYCQMDRFTWLMDGESIDFEKDKKGETSFESSAGIVKNNFYSLNKDQDSLQFKSLSAKYDLKQQAIFCSKVDFVEVGDARIFPDSGFLVVRKSAVIDPLKNAQIVANDIDTFHRFIDANIQIFGRNRFEGVCKYPYKDKDNNVTIVPMKSIGFDKKYTITIATGEVLEKDNFKLSKQFDYFGKINIYSNNKGLLLDGSTRLNHPCKYDRSWMKFLDTVDAKNIQIPIAEKVFNAKNERLAVGFLWRDSPKIDSLRIYPAFLSKVEAENDPVLYTTMGYIQFNDKSNEFQIGTKDRLNKKDSLSNILTLHLGTCFLTGIGDINLGVNYGEVKIDGYGKIEYNTEELKTNISMNARVSIPVSKDVTENLGNKLKVIEGLPELDLKKPNYALRFNFNHWVGSEKAEDIFKDYDEDKLKKMPDGLDQTFVLAGLQLESFGTAKGGGKKIDKGLISRQKQVGLVSVNGAPVLKMVDMQMFFNQTHSEESGQSFYWSINTPTEKKYFMYYNMDKKDGDLGFYSNDETFKKTISEIKSDKRKTKNFKFDLIPDGDALNLLSKFNGFFLYK
jgi:hypothetical protein